jgi:hypothetical protein
VGFLTIRVVAEAGMGGKRSFRSLLQLRTLNGSVDQPWLLTQALLAARIKAR